MSKKHKHIGMIIGAFGLVLVLALGSIFFFNNPDDPISTYPPQDRFVEINFHFPDGNFGWDVEAKQIQTGNRQDMIEATLEMLKEGPQAFGLTPSIPEGLEVGWFDFNAATSTLRLSFYPSLEELSLLERTTLIISVVHTMRELEFVEYIVFYEGYEELLGADGQPFGPRNRSNTPLGAETPQPASIYITLFYPNEQMTGLVAEVRSVPFDSAQTNIETLVVSNLLQGPQTEGLLSIFPQDIALNNNVSSMGELTVVDFTAGFRDALERGGTLMEWMMIYTLVNTLTEISSIERVQFFIEGQPIVDDLLGVHLDLSRPFERNESLITTLDPSGD